MGLSSVMQTALTGISGAETLIAVAANNLANSQTTGFKQSRAQFTTQSPQSLSAGSAPSSRAGGTNPIQIGGGVRVGAISMDSSQGTIAVSSSPTDIGQNMIDLNSASLMLRASVQVLATADEMFEALTNLGRR